MCWVCFVKVLIHLLFGKIFLYQFLWILFVMGLEQIPGMNLKMTISANVDNLMNKMGHNAREFPSDKILTIRETRLIR